jgi:hypothetical protein
MKKSPTILKWLMAILTVLFIWPSLDVNGQCLTAIGQYPSTTFNPSCTGVTEIIATDVWAGEYSKVNVQEGITYVFTSSVLTDFITISDDAGTVPYAFGTTPVSWTSTITGTVRFYDHTNEFCSNQSVSRTTAVSCTIPTPANDLCADAIVISCGDIITGSTDHSTAIGAPGSVCSATTLSGSGVWYKFTGTGLPITVSLCGSSYNTKLGVFTGTCGSLTCVGANDDFCGSQSEIAFSSISGTEYIVYVSGSGSETGDFTLSLSCAAPGLEIITPNLDLGYRPIGAWMEPARLEVINYPGVGDLTITAADIDNNYGGFISVVNPPLPYTLTAGSTTTEFGLTTMGSEVSAGAFNGTYALIYGSGRALATVTYGGTAYVPIERDVVETAMDLGAFSAPASGVIEKPEFQDREIYGFYKNYILPNDIGTGPQDNDIVYKFTLLNDKIFTLESPDNVNFAIYAEDFNDQPGPMASNALYQAYSNLTAPLFAGTYYFVGSALANWAGNYAFSDMPSPDAVTYLAPADGAINITNGMFLSWEFGENTYEYQLVLGTTYPPTTVIVPWTTDLLESYQLSGLQPNMQYFWQVNVRNSNGTTMGPVWGFTTTIDVPTGLTATVIDPSPADPLVSIALNWDNISNRAFLGYNVYRDGAKINTTPVPTSEYTDLGMARNTTYIYRISAVFDEGESALSTPVTVTTKGVGTFIGHVYDFLTSGPIEDSRIDILGPAGSYTILTDAIGLYTTPVYAGTYEITASADGYLSQTKTLQAVIHNSTVTNDFYLMEIPYPVEEVIATEINDNEVEITWGGQGADPIDEWLIYDSDQVYFAGIGAESNNYSLIWASKFIPEQLEGYTYITKVAVYQYYEPDDFVTEVRIMSQDGYTILYSQDVTGELHGSQWNIIELDDPVPFNNSQNLWIGMYVERAGGTYNEPTSNALTVIDERYDFFAYNGDAWTSTYDEYGFAGQAWMLRGFVTNYIGGKEFVLGEYEPGEYKEYSRIPRIPSGNGMIRATEENSKFPEYLKSTRGVVDYSVFREKVFQPGVLELVGTTFQDSFVDFEWGDQDWGVYRWAVAVNYDAGQTSPLTYSNTLDKDMYTTVDVTVVLNSNDSPGGTQVTFTNTSEPLLELVYDISLPGTGMYTWDEFRRGVYDINVFKIGYSQIEIEDVEIFDESSFEWLLTEILAPPTGLYVTPTAYATWMAGSSIPFEPMIESFDGGVIPEGWTVTEGSEGDPGGDMWHVVNPVSGRIFTNTPYMLVDSDDAGMVITNSILTSPVIDASNAGALYLSFDQYFKEYSYSDDWAKVQVFDGSDWVTILNQTADIGSWSVPNHQVIDVTAYANPDFQVRFEYYGDWAFYWALDNVQITESSTRMSERSLIGFKVFLDGVLVEDTPDRFYQYGTNGEELIDGETYLAEVAAEYSTGQSARAQYTFTYIACDNYDVPGNFVADQVEGTLDVALTWTVPTVPGDQIDFARIYRDGEVIDEVTTTTYLDEDMALGTYQYCITFIYESGAESCQDAVCATVAVVGDGIVNGNVSQAAYLGGDPIEGAVVTITNVDNPSMIFTYEADEDGDYEGEVVAGTYDYVVTATGYVTATLEDVVIPQSATVTRDFELMEFPAPVEMVVAEELSDATVRVSWRTPGTNLFEDFIEDFTGGIGDWTLQPATNWQLSQTANAGGTSPEAMFNWSPSGEGEYYFISPNMPATAGLSQLYLSFKHYLNHFSTSYPYSVRVVTIADGVEHLVQEWTPTASISANTFNITLTAAHGLGAIDFRIAFVFDGDTFGVNYWYIDDVKVTKNATRSLRDNIPPVSTLAGYNVYRTGCYDGDLQFMGYTLDTIFDDNTWVSAEAGVYKWGVEAVYAANESEVRYSNCLDKDMVTQVSVTVITNSGDSPDGTDVMFTNISEPDLGLIYETELDSTGYYIWEEFRKGVYDIYAEKNGFEPIILDDYVIDGPEAFEWVLQELLLPVGNLHVSPTGYATWTAGGTIPFEGFLETFDEGIPETWTIEDGGNSADTWYMETPEGNPQSSGASLDGTPFAYVDSDEAGSGVIMDEILISPVINVSSVDELWLHFDQYYNNLSSSEYAKVDVFDGDDWVTILNQSADAGSWTSANHQAIDVSELINDAFQVRFHYYAPGWYWYWAVDNVALSETNENGRELEYYKVWLDGIFVTDTPDTWYQYDQSTLVPGQEYFSEVAAMYTNGMSPKMNYTWTYYPCDSFPGPEDLAYEIVDNSDVVLTWGGSGPPPPPGGGLSEDFESGSLSAGWTVDQTNTTTSGPTPGYWTVNDYVSTDFVPFGTYHAGLWWDYSHQDEWLITPEFTCDAGASLNFWTVCYKGSTNGDHYYVKVSTDGGSTWTSIWDASAQSGGWNYYDSPVNLGLSAYAGEDIKLAFHAVDGDGQGLWYIFFVDNITVGTGTRSISFPAESLTRKSYSTTSNDMVARDGNTSRGERSLYAEKDPNASPRNVSGERAIWDLVYSFDADTPSALTGLAGSETDGTYIYAAKWSGSDIAKFDAEGNFIETFTIPGVSGLRDLAFDGTYMYGAAATTTVWKMDFTTKTLVGTFTAPTAVRAIAYDSEADAFWGNNWSTDMILFNEAGQNLDQLSGMPSMYGAAYDNFSDGGPYLWFFTGTTTGGGCQVEQYNLGTQTLTGVSHSVSGDLGDYIAGGLYVTEDLINDKVVLGGLAQGTPDMTFGYEIKSTGGGGGGSSTFDPGEFLGASVYRNGELIAEGIMEETYTDEDVEPGYYDYCVVFVYEEGAMSCMTSCVEDVLILEDCAVPQGLTAEVNGSETWTALLTWNTFAGIWLSYGDLIYADAIGLTDYSPITVAIQFDPADLAEYDGKEFSKMRFYYGTGSIGTVNAQIWEGTTLVMEQTVASTIVGESWNTVEYTDPVIIDATKSYKIGYTVSGYDAYPAGAQDYTGDPNSDLVYMDGVWDNLSNYLPYSWLIEAFISQPREAGNANEAVVSNVTGYSSTATLASAPSVNTERSNFGRAADRAFLGYNVYRDGVMVNEEPVPENMYLDTPGGAAGEYCYTVTALYEYCGETEHSNEDCVILTSASDISLSSLRIYPNPSNSSVTIELTNDVKQVLIYNYAGQLVHERAINKDKNIEVDVRHYEAGAYLVRFITNSGESFAKKIAVTK